MVSWGVSPGGGGGGGGGGGRAGAGESDVGGGIGVLSFGGGVAFVSVAVSTGAVCAGGGFAGLSSLCSFVLLVRGLSHTPALTSRLEMHSLKLEAIHYSRTSISVGARDGENVPTPLFLLMIVYNNHNIFTQDGLNKSKYNKFKLSVLGL